MSGRERVWKGAGGVLGFAGHTVPCTTLPLWCESLHRCDVPCVHKQVWLFSNKTLFTVAGGGLQWAGGYSLLTAGTERDSELYLQAMQPMCVSSNIYLLLEQGCSQGHCLPAPSGQPQALGGEAGCCCRKPQMWVHVGGAKGLQGEHRRLCYSPPQPCEHYFTMSKTRLREVRR